MVKKLESLVKADVGWNNWEKALGRKYGIEMHRGEESPFPAVGRNKANEFWELGGSRPVGACCR